MQQPARSARATIGEFWRRLADWLGLDRSAEPDLLLTDPARHFLEWDRNLPNRYWG